MADYTLKIDIDEAEFTRKLQKALGKVTFGGGAGAPGGGGSAIGGADRFDRAHRNKLAEMEREFTLRGQHWAGRMGGQAILNQQKFGLNKELVELRGKFFGKKQLGDKFEAQLVKLSGFAIGLTGAASFSKAVIDSSPILQAYLKILQTGIMFILRPIGDTIGFFIRPLSIALLQWAIPFYQKAVPFTRLAGEAGEALLELDFPTAFFKLQNAFLGVLGFMTEEEIAVAEENRKIREQRLEDDLAWWGNLFSGIGDLFNINFSLFQTAFADTGENADEATAKLDIFSQALDTIRGAVVNFFTMDKDAGPGGADNPHTKHVKGGGNTISRDEFNQLVKTLGTSGALKYVRESGMTVDWDRGKDYTIGTTGQPGRFGVNVTIQKIELDATDAQIGAKIRDEIQIQWKKFPGHR